MNLKYRIAIILALVAASIWTLFPRTVVERVKRNGEFVYDTVRRVPLKRGLDLQGGMHLALEVDDSKGPVANKATAIDNALKVVRNRIDEFGVSEPVVQKEGNDRIIVELPGIDDPQRAQDVVQKSAFLEMQITDKTQALEKALPRIDALLKNTKVNVASAATPGAAKDTGNAGLQSLFTADTSKKADTSKTDSTKGVAGTAGGPGAFSKLVQPGSFPGEYLVSQTDVQQVTQYLSLPEVQAALPPAKVVRWSSDTLAYGGRVYRPLYVLDAKPIITGEYLTDAKPNTSPTEGNIVEFQMNNEGARRFRTETSRHINDFMAIVLDQRVMGRPPVIQSAIGARGQITMGGKDLQAAQDLALVLRAGSLPVPLKVADVREIGASLGQDSIHKGITAGIIAVALVVVVMLGYYRFSGSARGRRARALHPLHARGAGGIQRRAHSARTRRLRAVDRYSG
jgi:preprotein translocase subunit SecD